MVAKISFGSSLYGALAYNAEKIDEGKGKVLGANKTFYNKDGIFNLHSCLEDFNARMPLHVATRKPIVHISLNPHPDDKLSDEQLSAIGTEYLERMGYGNQPYLIYKHEDIERHHIHIVTLGVDEQGKKIDDGNNFFRSKKITRELEQRYGLLPAEKQKEREAYRYRKVNIADGNIKKQVGAVVKPLMRAYRFLSFGEYRALLSRYNITVEEVKGEVKGKPYHGLVYWATNDKGEKVSNPFKSSVFGKAAGADAMLRRFEESKKQMTDKKLGLRTREMILTSMGRCQSLAELEKELSLKGIDTLFRRSETGRIYGATFIDHNEGCVLNGSRMGKELSANAIEAWSIAPHNPLQETISITEEQPFTKLQNDNYFDESGSLTSLGGILDLPIEAQGTDYEEEAFRRRMQRKKKKGRKI